MAYKTILAHINHHDRSSARLNVALQLAHDFDAHLIGLHVDQYPLIQTYALEGNSIAVIQSLINEGAKQTEAARKIFNEGISHSEQNKHEWRAVEGMVPGELALHGRYADLIVVGQPSPESEDYPALLQDFPASLALTVARPILVVPYAGQFPVVGKNIVIAWNGSRESTRAVSDALPLLKQAQNVTVMTIQTEPRSSPEIRISGADLALYLSRHDVNVEVSQQKNSVVDTGESLLSRATDFDADLIVMGVYGHWRLRELILGGVTQSLMRSMTVPIFISH